MDIVGAMVKCAIDNCVAFNPNEAIKNTSDLLPHLKITNFIILTYTTKNVVAWRNKIPNKLNIKKRKTDFGIGAAHEIFVGDSNFTRGNDLCLV